jgi:predicted AAA+ superfamily ATPase
VNRGGLAELFVGLELLKAAPATEPRRLYYWHREGKNSNAEVDFVLPMDGAIIPLEVKSGTRGAMQSLQVFLQEKRAPYGIRCSLENFGEMDGVKIYPLYAVGAMLCPKDFF